MFSSIEERERTAVIKKCYWPLFRLAEIGIPIGIEATALTLEIINDIDSEWITALNNYINEEKVEFIGSGYSQIIGPLVPEKVNEWNQKLGLDVYADLLRVRPRIALVNEMAYSAGIVEHYLNNEYEAIIMEWNNPRKYHPEWEDEFRFFPQKAIGTNGSTISLIWADTIAFQKFQRYAHGEYPIIEYLNYLEKRHIDDGRYFPLYLNDVEIFDYRPGRYHTEPKLGKVSEWDRIIDLYKKLSDEKWVSFILPSQILDMPKNEKCFHEIKLESPEQPIPVKKQEKYNINRWALTGKDDLGINTKCYQIYERLKCKNNENQSDWKELCYLWSSDFRTHITEKRWEKYQKRLKTANDNAIAEKINLSSSKALPLSIPFYKYGVKCSEDENTIVIENERIRLVLDKSRGMSISRCILKDLSDKSLFGTLGHGYFDDISFAEDYYSGNAVIERLGQHIITDLDEVLPKVFLNESGLVFRSRQQTETYWGNVRTQQKISFVSNLVLEEKGIRFYKTILFQDDIWWRAFLGMAVIRPFSITFNPEAWDLRTLYYKTHNGGNYYEIFHLDGKGFNQGNIYSTLISSMHGLGTTDGVIVIGDKDKSITLKCNMAKLAIIPSVVFNSQDNKYFFRVQYSAREVDETVSKKNEIRSLDMEIFIE